MVATFGRLAGQARQGPKPLFNLHPGCLCLEGSEGTSRGRSNEWMSISTNKPGDIAGRTFWDDVAPWNSRMRDLMQELWSGRLISGDFAPRSYTKPTRLSASPISVGFRGWTPWLAHPRSLVAPEIRALPR